MAVQLPATWTTARWLSRRAREACWERSMRVEGSSSPARICCQRAARSGVSVLVAVTGSGAGAGVAASGATGATTTSGAGGAGAGAAGVGAAACGVGRGLVVGTLVAIATAGSAKRPRRSTSSQSRGCTLWRSCCSLPLSCACQRSRVALPMLRARSGSSPRIWGEKLVSSRRLGATPASTRSRSRPAIPWSTAPGSRPRSSRLRIASITPSGSAPARAWASCSSSCSGTAPSNSQTAVGSTGPGSKLS